MVLIANSLLNKLLSKFLVSKALIDWNISHGEVVLINNVLKENGDMKGGIKNLKPLTVYWRFYSICKAMLRYCLKCRKNTENKNPKFVMRKSQRKMLLSKFALCDSKNLTFIEDQVASGLSISLGIKAILSKIPLVGPLLF